MIPLEPLENSQMLCKRIPLVSKLISWRRLLTQKLEIWKLLTTTWSRRSPKISRFVKIPFLCSWSLKLKFAVNNGMKRFWPLSTLLSSQAFKILQVLLITLKLQGWVCLLVKRKGQEFSWTLSKFIVKSKISMRQEKFSPVLFRNLPTLLKRFVLC